MNSLEPVHYLDKTTVMKGYPKQTGLGHRRDMLSNLTKQKFAHECIEKPAYPTHGEALRKLYFCMVRKGVLDMRLRPYECSFAPHFHLGKTTTRRTHE